MAITVFQFAELVGMIIHACGSLEMLTNNAIKRLGKDPLVSRKMVKLRFSRRIKILRDLLHDRTKLSREDVDSLCDEFSKIAQDRNVIAHNPIVSDDEKGPAILVVRHKFDPPQYEKVTEPELQHLLMRVHAAVNRFAQLVPESTKD